MASSEKNLSSDVDFDSADLSELEIGLVVSNWNEEITTALREGCVSSLESKGLTQSQLHILQVPGAYELPLGARMLDEKHGLDAVICLGCVIKGETRHDEYINQSVANALMQLSVMKSKPYVFGLLTCDTMEQALDRAGGKHGNKGVECAVTAIQMILIRKELKKSAKKIGFS